MVLETQPTEAQMSILFMFKIVAFIALSISLYYSIKLREKTKKITPLWLFMTLAIVFLQIYALSDVIEFGSNMIFEENIAKSVANTMDWFEMAILAASASFFTASGLLLKESKIKPI